MRTDTDLTKLSDEDLEREAASRILDAALMNGTQWADKHHAACDEIYAECHRRSRGIYQRAWNSDVRSQGHRSMARPVDPAGV
jgi:hypothetical protein